MNNLLRKGLVSLVLGTAALSALDSNRIYCQESKESKRYLNHEPSSSPPSKAYRENEGFSSEGLVYAGFIALGAFYVFKKISKSRKKQ